MIWFYDDDAKKKIDEEMKKIGEIPKKTMDSYLKREQNPAYIRKTKDTGIIQKGSKSMVGEMVIQEAEEMKLYHSRRIYQELLLLFKRKNELSKVRKIGAYD